MKEKSNKGSFQQTKLPRGLGKVSDYCRQPRGESIATFIKEKIQANS